MRTNTKFLYGLQIFILLIPNVQMTDGKHTMIQRLFQKYDIKTAENIQDALKEMMKVEM